MADKTYLQYSERLGVKYGLTESGKWERIKTKVAKRGYTTSKNHAGWINVSKKYRHTFPNGVVKKGDSGKYRIGMRFSKEQMKYQPFSALNAKKSGVTVIDGRNFASHILGVIERLSIGSQNFAIIVSLRAKRVFQESFKYKKFYSAGGDNWKALKPSTIKKRKLRGTWPGVNGMLAEYGNMYDSIDTEPINNIGGITTGMRVFTDPSRYQPHTNVGRKKFKRGSVSIKRRFCYAGLHNEGGTIRGGYKLPKRQFMGYSSYIVDFANQEMNKYLFYNVFT